MTPGNQASSPSFLNLEGSNKGSLKPKTMLTLIQPTIQEWADREGAKEGAAFNSNQALKQGRS